MQKVLVSVLRWVIALALPIFLLLTVSRLVIADWFPASEYGKADFPRDTYGWTQEQRLQLALPSIHFLNSPLPAEQAISLLAEQVHPGTHQPLFTPSELSHMEDVKRLVDQLWRVQVIAGILAVGGLIVLLARRATRGSGYFALFVGGVLTVALLAFLGFFVVVGFDSLFVTFHELFFPQGNWTFDYSDSLIRLYPEKLWFDAGFLISVATLVSGIVIGAIGFVLWHRSEQSAALETVKAAGQRG